MANPFYTAATQKTTQNSSNNNLNLNDIYNLLKKSNNPKQVFDNIAMKNPKMAPIVNLLNKGYSPEQVFYTICQQRGLNPQEVLKNITR